jgi:hypothetical protein
MAPEVARDERYGHKVDVFSFGVVMFEVFARDLVAASHVSASNMEGYIQFAQKVAWMAFRPPIPPHVPGPVAALIAACWHQVSGAPLWRAGGWVGDAHVRLLWTVAGNTPGADAGHAAP